MYSFHILQNVTINYVSKGNRTSQLMSGSRTDFIINSWTIIVKILILDSKQEWTMNGVHVRVILIEGIICVH